MSTEPNSTESVVTNTPGVPPADVQVAKAADAVVGSPPPPVTEPANSGSMTITPETGVLYGADPNELPPQAPQPPQTPAPEPLQQPVSETVPPMPEASADALVVQLTAEVASLKAQLAEAKSAHAVSSADAHVVIDDWFSEHFHALKMKCIERVDWIEVERTRVSAALSVLKTRLGL